MEEISSTFVEEIAKKPQNNSRTGWTAEIAPPDPINDSAQSQIEPLGSRRIVRAPRQQSLPTNRGVENAVLMVDDARSTDDSSSQASSSMKSVTRRSGDMSAQLRQRIRQQAKQLVEQKRGSAQLARRLQRGRSLPQTTIAEGNLFSTVASTLLAQDSLENDTLVDKQIEESVKLGEKYVHDIYSAIPPEHIQRAFFFGEKPENFEFDPELKDGLKFSTKLKNENNNVDEKNERNKTALSNESFPLESVVHAKAHFPTSVALKAFEEQITKLPASFPLSRAGEESGPTMLPVNMQDPLSKMEPSMFAARSPRDLSAILYHIGDRFLVNEKRDILGFEKIVVNKAVRLVHKDEEEAELQSLISYRRAINFEKLSDDSNRMRSMRLQIDINRIEFEHHWLYTREDEAGCTLRSAVQRYTICVDELINLLRKYLALPQNDMGPLSPKNVELRDEEQNQILEKIKLQKNLAFKLFQDTQQAWNMLKKVRDDTKIQNTAIELHTSEFTAISTPMKNFLQNMELTEIFDDILRMPSLWLTKGENEMQKKLEKNVKDRNQTLRKCRYNIEIYYNKILVCTTDDVPLIVDMSGRFTVTFGRVYRLYVGEQPHEICLRIREHFGAVTVGVTNYHDVARVYLPLFDEDTNSPIVDENTAKKSTEEDEKQEQRKSPGRPSHFDSDDLSADGDPIKTLHIAEFASEIIRESYKGSIGSGGIAPFVHGKLYYNVKWQNNRSFEFVNKDRRIECPQIAASKEKFELIPDAVALCSEEEFQSQFASQIDAQKWRLSSFSGLARQLSSKSRSGMSSSDLFGTFVDDTFALMSGGGTLSNGNELSLDAYRRVGHAHSVLIRRHLVENFAIEQRFRTYSEIVHEESLPVLFRTFGTLFTPPDISRKLKPMRLPSTRTQQTVQNSYKLVVNVQSAINLPERISNEGSNVFAEASFQKSSARSTVVQGHSANWQETLTLECQFASRHSQQPFDPRTVIDVLELDIFDQIIRPLEFDNREPNTFHEQVENVLLGSIRIPFSTIYSLGKVDGLLTMKTPLFISGYRMPDQRRHASVRIMVAIDPPLVAPSFTLHESFHCGESNEKFFLKAKRWEARMRAAFRDRRFVALANDSNGKRILASRFLCKILPPVSIITLADTNVYEALMMCVDLVASIPAVNDAVFYPGVCDVWISAFEMLKVGCGTAEEKAILLACWLMGLNLEVSVVFGCALPEGLRSAYVLIKMDVSTFSMTADTPTNLLINPTDGLCYSINDPTIPFNVGSILTSQNAFANVQRTTHPSLLDFDFRKRQNWIPLFSNDRSDLVSVQTDVIRYVNVSENLLAELRAILEREIKLHFDEARQHGIPQWNILASKTLRDILQDFWVADSSPHTAQMETHVPWSRPAHSRLLRDKTRSRFNTALNVDARLDALRASYHLNSSAFCCAYISKRDIIERVMKLRAHLRAGVPYVQHALAVHVQPFVNQLVSVSVALAVLTPLTAAGGAPPSTPWTGTSGAFFPHKGKK